MTDQVDLSGEVPEAGLPPDKKYLTVREAVFIGVGSMVGAGIFALLGVVLDFWWKRVRADRAKQVPVAS